MSAAAAALSCRRALERSRGAPVAVQDEQVVRRLVVAADADADALDPAAARNGLQERRRLPVPAAAAGAVGPCSRIKTHRLFAARARGRTYCSVLAIDRPKAVALRVREARTWGTGKRRRRRHGAIKKAVEMRSSISTEKK